jgi:hypothetical protein
VRLCLASASLSTFAPEVSGDPPYHAGTVSDVSSDFSKNLDQANINNAYVSGMKEALQMNGSQLTYAGNCFTAVRAHVFVNLKRVNPRTAIETMSQRKILVCSAAHALGCPKIASDVSLGLRDRADTRCHPCHSGTAIDCSADVRDPVVDMHVLYSYNYQHVSPLCLAVPCGSVRECLCAYLRL